MKLKPFKRFPFFTLVRSEGVFWLCPMNPNRASFGRPIKKASRIGKSRLNKIGHRSNPTS